MNAQKIEELMTSIMALPDSEIEETLLAVAVITLGTIRVRKGVQFLRGFCAEATAENSSQVFIQKVKSH